MGKVRLRVYEHSCDLNGKFTTYTSEPRWIEPGDYWPDADYRALEAENEQLEMMLKDAVHAVSDDDDEVMALEAENKRLHKYERWFDDIYGMMPGILWDSGKLAWNKEKAFKKLLEICETADQFKVLKKEHNRIQTKLAALVGLADSIILSEPMPGGEPAESVWLGRQQVADEIKAALDAAKEG